MLAAAGYAFFLSPNQTPTLDTYYLKKLSGLAGNDGFTINPIFEQLFFIMGIWPVRFGSSCLCQAETLAKHVSWHLAMQAIYAALLIPGGRSGNKVTCHSFSVHTNSVSTADHEALQVPAWPFVSLSFGLGYFALGPYFAGVWCCSTAAIPSQQPPVSANGIACSVDALARGGCDLSLTQGRRGVACYLEQLLCLKEGCCMSVKQTARDVRACRSNWPDMPAQRWSRPSQLSSCWAAWRCS